MRETVCWETVCKKNQPENRTEDNAGGSDFFRRHQDKAGSRKTGQTEGQVKTVNKKT